MDLVTARYRYARRPRGSRVSDGDSFALVGGLNLEDSPLLVKPGQLLACKNYEPKSGSGYSRIRGFERFDGRTLASKAPYSILKYSRATAIPPVQFSVTGQQSGATGVVAVITQDTPITTVNLLRRSEEMGDTSAWTHLDVTVGDSGIENPIDGSLNAVWLAETAANTEHGAVQVVAKPALALTYWYSVYVRPHGGTSGAALRAFFSVSKAEIKFDFSAGSASAVEQNGDFLGLEEYMEQLPNGWWRLGVKFRASVQPSLSCMVLSAAPGGILTYPGDPDRGIEVVGAQIEQVSGDSPQPSAYVETDGFARGNGAGHYVLVRTSGAFIDGERIQVSGVDHSQANGVATQNNAATDELDLQYRKTASALARAQITQPGGFSSKPVSGVAIYKGVGYALRELSDGSGAGLFKGTANGWLLVNLGRKLSFTGGLPAGIAEGDTVTGATSGATGVVRRVVVQTGTFAGSNAAGYLIIPTVTGTFNNGEVLRVGGTDRATTSSTAVFQSLVPGGRLETRIHNFYGHSSTERLYAVDGLNRAWEYQDNPEFFCLIETGMTNDAPKHLAVHGDQLWLAFSGGSLQRSSVGDPVSWQVTLGATELAVGAEITGLLEEIGDTLFVFTRNLTKYVAGTVTDYALKNFSIETGAMEWTVQRIGMGIYLDDRGFTSLSATQKFGNYVSSSFSAQAQRLIDELKSSGAISSCVVKNKNLYRCFFSDGRFVSIGVEGSKVTGITTGDLGKVVRCVVSGEDSSGNEMILFGSDDGFVYRMESGPNADGNKIEAFLRTAFHFSGSPQRRKRYRGALFQVRTNGKCTLKISADYSFANPDEATESIRDVALDGGGGLWNVAQWNEFRWNTGLVADASIKLEASGTNVGFLVAHEADDEEEHSIDSVVLRQSIRRPERGAKYG